MSSKIPTGILVTKARYVLYATSGTVKLTATHARNQVTIDSGSVVSLDSYTNFQLTYSSSANSSAGSFSIDPSANSLGNAFSAQLGDSFVLFVGVSALMSPQWTQIIVCDSGSLLAQSSAFMRFSKSVYYSLSELCFVPQVPFVWGDFLLRFVNDNQVNGLSKEPSNSFPLYMLQLYRRGHGWMYVLPPASTEWTNAVLSTDPSAAINSPARYVVCQVASPTSGNDATYMIGCFDSSESTKLLVTPISTKTIVGNSHRPYMYMGPSTIDAGKITVRNDGKGCTLVYSGADLDEAYYATIQITNMQRKGVIEDADIITPEVMLMPANSTQEMTQAPNAPVHFPVIVTDAGQAVLNLFTSNSSFMVPILKALMSLTPSGGSQCLQVAYSDTTPILDTSGRKCPSITSAEPFSAIVPKLASMTIGQVCNDICTNNSKPDNALFYACRGALQEICDSKSEFSSHDACMCSSLNSLRASSRRILGSTYAEFEKNQLENNGYAVSASGDPRCWWPACSASSNLWNNPALAMKTLPCPSNKTSCYEAFSNISNTVDVEAHVRNSCGPQVYKKAAANSADTSKVQQMSYSTVYAPPKSTPGSVATADAGEQPEAESNGTEKHVASTGKKPVRAAGMSLIAVACVLAATAVVILVARLRSRA